MSESEIRKGRDAGRILNDPLFIEAFNGIESNLIDRMKRVPIGDRDTQHELILSLQLLANVRRHFAEMLETGKMAEIQKESTLKTKLRRMVG